jgi:hypothetical protein
VVLSSSFSALSEQSTFFDIAGSIFLLLALA